MSTYRSYRPQREREIIDFLRGWIFRTARGIETEAKNNAPRSTGTLAKSIKAILTFPTSIVTVNVPYGRFVEGYPQTTKRHFMPFGHYPMFDNWVKRHSKTRKFFAAWFKRLEKNSAAVGGLWVWGYAVKYFQRAIDKIRISATAELQRRHL